MFTSSPLDKSCVPPDNCQTGRNRFPVGITALGDENQQIRIQLAVHKYNSSPMNNRCAVLSPVRHSFLKNSLKAKGYEGDAESSSKSEKKNDNEYEGVGAFPTIHLKKRSVRYRPIRRFNDVKIPYPELPVNRFMSHLPEVCSNLKSTRSVLDVLEDLSGKKIHSKEENGSNKPKTKGLGGDYLLNPNAVYKPLFVQKPKICSVLTRDNTTQTLSPVISETPSPQSNNSFIGNDSSDPRAELRRKLAKQNNEIFASLSSSISSFAIKRKIDKVLPAKDEDSIPNGSVTKKSKTSDHEPKTNGYENSKVKSTRPKVESYTNRPVRKSKPIEASSPASPNKDRLTTIFLDMQNTSPKAQMFPKSTPPPSSQDSIPEEKVSSSGPVNGSVENLPEKRDNSETEKPESRKPETEQPKSMFSTPVSEVKTTPSDVTKPTFSFGANTTTTFSFPTEKKEPEASKSPTDKTASKFGNESSLKPEVITPQFSIGTTITTSASITTPTKPTISFSPSEEKKEDKAKAEPTVTSPKFTFGQKNSPKTTTGNLFSFGQKTEPPVSTATTQEQKFQFTFGQKPEEQKLIFSFGKTSTETTTTTITTASTTIQQTPFNLSTTTTIENQSFGVKTPIFTSSAQNSTFGSQTPISSVKFAVSAPQFGVPITSTTQSGTNFKPTSQPVSTFKSSVTQVNPSFAVSSTAQSTPEFGITTQSTIGFSSATTQSAPTFAFGVSSSATSTTFGTPTSTKNSGFGAPTSTNSIAFGVSSSATTTAFGTSTTATSTLFGTPASTSSTAFGAPTSTKNTGFGSPASTTSASFGAPTCTTSTLFGASSSTTNTTFGASASATNTLFGPPSSTINTTFGAPVSTRSIAFGAPASTASTTFGASTSTPSTLFGASTSTTSSAFGAPTSTAGALFGAPVSTTSTTFGAPTSTTSTVFGASSSATSSPFGVPSSTTSALFGAPVSTTSTTFGAPTSTTSALFGAPVSTTSTTFGAPTSTTSTVFGASSSATSSPFGVPSSTPSTAFGASALNTSKTFGAPTSTQPFGVTDFNTTTTQPSFGSPATSTFSTSTPSILGQIPTPAFNNNVFGAKPTENTFGAAQPFGTQNKFSFGMSTSNPTGFTTTPAVTTSSPVFSFGSSSTSNTFTFGSNTQTPFSFKPPTNEPFKFGAATTKETPNFGSSNVSFYKNSEQKPAFNFGAPQTSAPFTFGTTPSPSVFSFGGSTSSSSGNFNFGTPSPFGQAATGTPFAGPGTFSIGSGSSQSRPRATSRPRRRP